MLCTAWKYCFSHQTQEHRRGSNQWSPHCVQWEQEGTKRMSYFFLQEWLWDPVVDQWGLVKEQVLKRYYSLICKPHYWIYPCHPQRLSSKPRTLPLTERVIDFDLVAPVTSSGCREVRVTTHVYVPLSMEELDGENTNWERNTVLLTWICVRRVTRPLTPENTAPSLVHVLFTATSLSVTRPSKMILQFRVILLPV